MQYAHCADLSQVRYFVLVRPLRVAARPTTVDKADRKVLHSWSNLTPGTPVTRGRRPCANQHFRIRRGLQVQQAYSPICAHTRLVFTQN